LAVVAGFVLLLISSFVFGHWHGAWRAVVLDVRQDQMFLGYARKPPEWVDGKITEPGNIVMKEPWTWSSEATTVNIDDDKLVELYQRYTKTYTGTLVEIRQPSRPGAFPMGVIRTDDGAREYVTLVDTVLMGGEINRRVEKTTGTWDPQLLPKEAADVQLAPNVLPPAPVTPPPGPATPPPGPATPRPVTPP
jgi:hypothetical protein